MKLPRILSSILFCVSLGNLSCFGDPPKVIIDTDFNTIGDDGQVAVMAAQLYSQGVIDLLGFTIPTGNQWRYCAPRFPITSFHWTAQMLFP
jgi:hypothetical protein